MAFNPFANFRKYQKIWMAAILLITMVVFVLCTGTRGDFMDTLERWLRPRGSVTATIDGDNLYYGDLSELRMRRNVANDFMSKTKGRIVERLDEFLKTDIKKIEAAIPDAKKREEKLLLANELRRDFELRFGKDRRYFGGGVKLDDLIDHKLWLLEADRLGVELSDDSVLLLVQRDMGGPEWWDLRVFNEALYEVRWNNQNVNKARLLDCLRDEYRARAAQFALNEVGVTRVSLTPGQMWEWYKEKRVEYNIALLPLAVDDFLKQVRQPTDIELNNFFDANKNNRYDPTSDKVGFEIPNRVKIAWISADPKSDFYKKSARLVIDLETTMLPLGAPALAPLQLAASAAARTGAAAKQFDQLASRSRFFTSELTQAGSDLAVLDYLMHKDAFGAAATILPGARLDAGIALLPSRYAMGLARHGKKHAAAVQEEAKHRAPIYASLVLLGNSHGGLAFGGVWETLERQPPYLPLTVIQEELLESIEFNVAVRWVQQQMQAVKRKLDNENISTRAAVERVLKEFAANKGLEQAETKDLYHRYNIHEAKELEPLYKSYLSHLDNINSIEGRTTAPEKKLKDSDFWKLFFDSQEPFAATLKYRAKAWPPVVTIGSQLVQMARMHAQHKLPQYEEIVRLADLAEPGKQPTLSLFKEADRPFLFWRTGEEPAVLPDKLEPVRQRVVDAWKFNKAREDEVLPRAKKIAEELQKTNAPLGQALGQELDKLKKDPGVKHEIIPLPRVTPLQPVSSGGFQQNKVYHEYQVPAGLIPLAREDTAKMLLQLYELKAPLETGNKQLDEINKALFSDKTPKGKHVQILTNKTRSMFYVAVVRDEPHTSMFDFRIATQGAYGPDELYATGQMEAVKRLREELNQQLRRHYKVEIVDTDARKNFDSDVSS